MKSRTLILVISIALVIALTIASNLGAQDTATQSKTSQHHHYKVVVMAPFGGPTSSFDNSPAPPSAGVVRILGGNGAMIAGGDTPIPDPYAFVDGWVNYVFRWQHGVQTNLGVLPEDTVVGPQTPCFDCAWSTFAYWVADNGYVAAASEYNAINPLTNSPATLAVLWKNDGKIVNLGTLGGIESQAAAVNNNGDVVGLAETSTSNPFPGRCPQVCEFLIFGDPQEEHAFFWRRGTMYDLGTLGGPDSTALYVNDRGQVAGVSDVDSNTNVTTGGPTVHPFIWENGAMQDLIADAPTGTFGGTQGMTGWLNQRGQVTGTMNLAGDATWHSFFWDHGTIEDLGTLGGINTTADAMNDAGSVVGKSDVTAICTACPAGNQLQLHHPFVWKDGAITDLGLLRGDTAGVAYSINAYDQVVGQSEPCTLIGSGDACDAVATVYHNVLWEHGSVVDVQTLLVRGSGITIDLAKNGELRTINDRGEIAGQGSLADGSLRAILLIPCDDDHPNVEGCDYSMVEASVAQSSNLAPPQDAVTQPSTSSPAQTVNSLRNRSMQRYRLPGQQAVPLRLAGQ